MLCKVLAASLHISLWLEENMFYEKFIYLNDPNSRISQFPNMSFFERCCMGVPKIKLLIRFVLTGLRYLGIGDHQTCSRFSVNFSNCLLFEYENIGRCHCISTITNRNDRIVPWVEKMMRYAALYGSSALFLLR